MKKSNPERQAKLKKRQAKKHRDYMASETRRIVDSRSGGQCEQLNAIYVRCWETEGLQHHHLTYARYGGKELPEDMRVVCRLCHEFLESLKPAGNRFTRGVR